jgi:uncharacterized membrane-anchored protein
VCIHFRRAPIGIGQKGARVEKKVAIGVLCLVTMLWTISVVITFIEEDEVIDPSLTALMTTIVGGVLWYLYKVGTKNGNGPPGDDEK